MMQRAWFIVLFIVSSTVLSLPSIVYAMTTAVPTAGSIFGAGSENVVIALRYTAPTAVTAINLLVVPNVARWFAKRLKLQSAGLLVAVRTTTTWLAPLLVVLFLNNACGKFWVKLWKECDTPARDLTITGPSATITWTSSSCASGLRKGYLEEEVLVAGSEICDWGLSAFDMTRCGRATIMTLAPFLTKKMAVTCFMVPACTVFRWRFFPPELKTLFASQKTAKPPAFAGTSGARRYHRRSLDGTVARRLVWFGLAVVFGPHIPILVLLVCVATAMDALTLRVGQSYFGLRQVRGKSSAPSSWAIVAMVLMQQSLSVFIFVGAGIQGYWWVVGAGVASCVLCAAIEIVPVSMLQALFGRCRCSVKTFMPASLNSAVAGMRGSAFNAARLSKTISRAKSGENKRASSGEHGIRLEMAQNPMATWQPAGPIKEQLEEKEQRLDQSKAT